MSSSTSVNECLALAVTKHVKAGIKVSWSYLFLVFRIYFAKDYRSDSMKWKAWGKLESNKYW